MAHYKSWHYSSWRCSSFRGDLEQWHVEDFFFFVFVHLTLAGSKPLVCLHARERKKQKDINRKSERALKLDLLQVRHNPS
jgi:hypothetical protein